MCNLSRVDLQNVFTPWRDESYLPTLPPFIGRLTLSLAHSLSIFYFSLKFVCCVRVTQPEDTGLSCASDVRTPIGDSALRNGVLMAFSNGCRADNSIVLPFPRLMQVAPAVASLSLTSTCS